MQDFKNNKGFTLIEVLVSVVLLAVVVSALFELYSRGFRGISKSETTFNAVVLAESALDEALAHKQPWSSPESPLEDLDITVTTSEVEDSHEVVITVRVSYRDIAKINLISAGVFYESR